VGGGCWSNFPTNIQGGNSDAMFLVYVNKFWDWGRTFNLFNPDKEKKSFEK